MFRNLTPHMIKVYQENEVILEVPAEEKEFQARVSEVVVDEFETEGIPTVEKEYGESNLPPFKTGVYLIVSKMVIDACPGRTDLRCPDTGPDSVVRDGTGRILGVKRLQAAPRG